MDSPFIRCAITDRRQLPPGTALLDIIARHLRVGIEWIQIREKDLWARELAGVVAGALALPNLAGSRILVNTRADVALATGAAGVHLPAGSPPAKILRSIAPSGFLIGVSCHTIEEVRAAEGEGVDYALFGPVFAPRSKPSDLPPHGLEALAEAAHAVRIPVLAIGGITQANTAQSVAAGAAGIAAISLFQEPGVSC